MAEEFGQSEDVWQGGISCGGGWFANSISYTGVNERTDDDGRWLRALLLLIEQGAMIAQQQKQIETLTAGLQKVSAQLEVSRPAPQVVNNP
jgi:hypothetical protein